MDPAVASYARHQMPPKINNQIVKEQDAEWSRHYCHRHSDANQRGSHSRRTCPLFVCVYSPLKLNFTLAALSLPCQPLPISFTLGLSLSHLRASFILCYGMVPNNPHPSQCRLFFYHLFNLGQHHFDLGQLMRLILSPRSPSVKPHPPRIPDQHFGFPACQNS